MQFRISDNECSLYIHWPFCRTRCSYCPFVAFAHHEQYMAQYQKALCDEMVLFAKDNAHVIVPTIYLGGGTPSTCPEHLLLDMFGRMNDVFDVDPLAEITIEVNPGNVTTSQIDSWQAAGINRLSIGVQYNNEAVLAKVNRNQSLSDVHWLFEHIGHHFKNISVDVMLGLPGITGAGWKRFLGQVVTWPIVHVSLYCLMVYENTPLYFQLKQNQFQLAPDELIGQLYRWSIDFLEEHGFIQYEVSNFARPGYESRHNMVYWDRKPYKGFGLGASSFDGSRRFSNESSLTKYFQAVKHGVSPVVFTEELMPEQIRLERVMLGLRRTMGINYHTLLEGLSSGECRGLVEKICHLKALGLLEQCDSSIRLSKAGFVVEQEVIAQLI